jgi:hypothetical protein
MKKILPLLLLAFCLSCESPITCDEPDPKAPYGTPDDVSYYDSTDGYRSITYTYYCYTGKYVAVTYTRVDRCTKYEKSEYVSSGICK